MNPDDMTDEQVAAMITAFRAMLERLTASIAEDFAAWEQELATPGAGGQLDAYRRE